MTGEKIVSLSLPRVYEESHLFLVSSNTEILRALSCPQNDTIDIVLLNLVLRDLIIISASVGNQNTITVRPTGPYEKSGEESVYRHIDK